MEINTNNILRAGLCPYVQHTSPKPERPVWSQQSRSPLKTSSSHRLSLLRGVIAVVDAAWTEGEVESYKRELKAGRPMNLTKTAVRRRGGFAAPEDEIALRLAAFPLRSFVNVWHRRQINMFLDDALSGRARSLGHLLGRCVRRVVLCIYRRSVKSHTLMWGRWPLWSRWIERGHRYGWGWGRFVRTRSRL